MTVAERAFCKAWLDARHHAVGTLSLVIATFIALLILATGSIIAPLAYPLLASLEGVFLGLAFGLFLARNRLSIPAWTFVTTTLQVLFVATWAVVLREALTSNHSFVGKAMIASVYLVIAIGGVVLAPVGGRLVALPAGASVLMGALAIRGVPGETSGWYLFVSISVGFAWMLQHRMVLGTVAEAKAEYRMRIRLAPAAMVHASVVSPLPLSELFKPKTRTCVCIASDWRDYQGAAARLSSDELARALDDYYAVCEQVLYASVPSGNFFLDWVADELFVVLFATSPEEEGRLKLEAVAFAQRLLVAKEAFRAERSVPRGIDIGIAAGRTLCGMIGPPGLRKAAALGTPALRARHLQSIGKGLRKTRGDQDRIVFGDDVAGPLIGGDLVTADEAPATEGRLYCVGAA